MFACSHVVGFSPFLLIILRVILKWMKPCLVQSLRVWHRKEAEGCDAVNDPRGRSRPHLPPSHHCRPVTPLWVKDDVLCAQSLVGARWCVVGGRAHGLRNIAVGLGLSAQELTSSLPEQPGELVFGRRLKRAKEEKEAAVEEWRQLQKDESFGTKKKINRTFHDFLAPHKCHSAQTSTSNIFVRTAAEGL